MQPETKPDTQRTVRALLAAARRERDKKLAATAEPDRRAPRSAAPRPPALHL